MVRLKSSPLRLQISSYSTMDCSPYYQSITLFPLFFFFFLKKSRYSKSTKQKHEIHRLAWNRPQDQRQNSVSPRRQQFLPCGNFSLVRFFSPLQISRPVDPTVHEPHHHPKPLLHPPRLPQPPCHRARHRLWRHWHGPFPSWTH